MRNILQAREQPLILFWNLMVLVSYNPILFEQLTGALIKWESLRTHGAAGPSGVNAYI